MRWSSDGTVVRSRSFPNHRRQRRRAGIAQLARPRTACRGARLPALLDGRAPQLARHRQRGDCGGARSCRGGNDAYQNRRRRHHAAEPCSAADRGTVRYPRRVASGAGRAGSGPCARLGSGHRPRRAPEPFGDVDEFPAGCRRADELFPPAEPGQAVQAVPGAGLEVPVWILGSSPMARSWRPISVCRSRSPRISRRR